MGDTFSYGRLKQFARDYRELCRPFSGLIVRATCWILILQVFALAEPYVVMRLIDGIVSSKQLDPAELLPLAALMMVLLCASGAIQVRKNSHIRNVWVAMDYALPLDCGRKLLSLPLSYHQSENTGAIISKVVRGVGKSSELMSVLLFEIVPLFLQTIVTVGILVFLYWPSVFVLALVMMVFTIVTSWAKVSMAEHRMKRHARDGQADEKLGQAVTNVMTTQAFAQEEREMRLATAIREDVRKMTYFEAKRYDLSDLMRNFLITFGRVSMVFLCAHAVLKDAITPGMMVFVITLADKIFISSYRISNVFDRMMEAAEPVMRMTQIFAEKSSVTEPGHPQLINGRLRGDVAFHDVTFHYRRHGAAASIKPAISGLTLDIKAGETIGIVGESGSGKSTLVRLLMRFNDPDRGTVSIDGLDLRTVRSTDIRPMIGYVPQEVEIYDETVAANIAYGRPSATCAEIEAAARVANAHDFISNLEHGYGEVVGNRGLRLSGGQRQRIGIARAILLDPPILVMDEATSHVDVVSEEKIRRSLEGLRQGRTVILIAHRLSTIQTADRIVVMKEGAIAEIGSHDELMRHNGLYSRLVELQGKIEATI